MRKILVTGASGFIGYEVSRQLVERGLEARLMVRRRERGRLLAALGAEVVHGDLSRPASLARAVSGCDTVLHLAARATFERYASVRPTIVGGSVALMEAARKAGVRSFVFASSLLVYGDADPVIDAATPARPRIGYGRAKVEAEEALRDLASPDLSLAIVRLPHVYGARSFLFEQLAKGRVVFPGSGENVYSHLHIEDAARVLIEAALQGWMGTSPVSDHHPATWNEFFAVLQDHYRSFHLVRIPAALALAGGVVVENLMRFSGRPTLYTADTVRGWLLSLPVERGLLWRDLELEPRYPGIEQGLPASLDDAVAFRWRHPVADRSRG